MEFRPDEGPAGAPRRALPPAPPEPGPTRGMRAGIAALAVTLGVALVVVGHAVVLDVATSRQPGESEAAVSAPSVAPPAAAPGQEAWALPDRSWKPLPAADPDSELFGAQSTALYAVEPPVLVDCPAPAVTNSEGEWRAAVVAQWACVHASWAPVFEELGWPSEAPAVEFFAGAGSDSDCGHLEAPAFYCASGPGRVYFGAEHYAMTRTWDLSVNEMVNHEYGHHLQYLAGVTSTRLLGGPSLEHERRAELQAICWAAAMTVSNRAVGFGAEDYASWLARLDSMLVDDIHGSRESIRHWGARGLYAATLGDCNTWVAPPEAVD